MGIFYRRPLCFFCFLFVVTSALLMSVTMASKLILLCALALCLIATVIMLIRSKNSKVALIALLLCICSVGIAVASSLLRMDIKEKQAKEYIGNHAVEISINSKEYSSA